MRLPKPSPVQSMRAGTAIGRSLTLTLTITFRLNFEKDENSPRKKLTKSNLELSEPPPWHSKYLFLHLPLFCNFRKTVSYPDFFAFFMPSSTMGPMLKS